MQQPAPEQAQPSRVWTQRQVEILTRLPLPFSLDGQNIDSSEGGEGQQQRGPAAAKASSSDDEGNYAKTQRFLEYHWGDPADSESAPTTPSEYKGWAEAEVHAAEADKRKPMKAKKATETAAAKRKPMKAKKATETAAAKRKPMKAMKAMKATQKKPGSSNNDVAQHRTMKVVKAKK